MPKHPGITKVLVIGSGPIVIGQAAEFDYAGTQACRALRDAGVETVLVNSNPATIMTDAGMASRVYLEPLRTEMISRILLEEKADAILASVGGQTALNIAMELAESGFLEEHGIRLLGTGPEGIRKGEDREAFRSAMENINIPCIPSGIAHSYDEARGLLETAGGYPVIIRPAFTLGGTGGGIASSDEELLKYCESGLAASRSRQILVEKSIAGWKEIEFEAIRDAGGSAVVICSMENFDPVGIHTGDSIVFAPAQTLSDPDLQMLREAVIRIVTELEIEGGCNVQFALHPDGGDYAIIEVNPRLSRSSALASKATGYPIAKAAAMIGLGYRLEEIKSSATGDSWADREPVLDYVVAKIPKWPFDKFVHADRGLGTQMKATGEVMALGKSLEESLIKAVRSLEQNQYGLLTESFRDLSDEDLDKLLVRADDRRLFVLAEALRRGREIAELYRLTRISPEFLEMTAGMVSTELALQESGEAAGDELLAAAFRAGYCDRGIADLTGLRRDAVRARRQELGYAISYRQVGTPSVSRPGESSYYYGTAGGLNTANKTARKKAIVLGSGPVRIGQGVEFDYCSVHAVKELRRLGWESIIINNNPETVSTDYDISDRLYFEPLTEEDVRAILENEQPDGVICQFGGQTAIKLIQYITDLGYPVFGTSADGVDMSEDRRRFDKVLQDTGILRAEGLTIYSTDEALEAAGRLGYPVLLRPSYVLGGQGMQICHNARDIRAYMAIINLNIQDHPILVDKYLMGKELEVDAVSDGHTVLIPGIMEHLERAGVHSGDSHSIFPAYISDRHRAAIVDCTEKLARALGVIGLINIQFILYNDEIYVLEVNPRSSRTVPFISKVSGLPLVALAIRVMLGSTVEEAGFGTGLYARYPEVYAIKAPVFSFQKLHEVDSRLGPEMKSTGEVLGLGRSYSEAMFKAIMASGFRFPEPHSRILMTVRDADKPDLLPLAERLQRLGYLLSGTGGTANYLNFQGVPASSVRRIDEAEPNAGSLIRSGEAGLLISTDMAEDENNTGMLLRRFAIERGVTTLTSLDTLLAVVECLEQGTGIEEVGTYDISEFSALVSASRLNQGPAAGRPGEAR